MESEIGINAVRVSRAEFDGTPDYGNSVGAFIVCGGVSSLEHDFETEEGSNIVERDAAGNLCINRRRPDDVTHATFTLTMCRDDPRLTEIILHGGATLLEDANGYPMGRGILGGATCGTSAPRGGVILELWTELYDCDVPKADWPYKRIILPFAQLTPAGYTHEDGLSLPVYNGIVHPNPNIGNGPFDDFDVVGDVSRLLYFDFYDDELPTCAPTLDYANLPAPS